MTSATERSTTTQVYRVYIRTTPEKVWDAITNPEWTEKFGYGGRAEYDLRPGGGLPRPRQRGDARRRRPRGRRRRRGDRGRPAAHRLVQTWRMLMDEDMIAEGFTRLTYEIDAMPSGATRARRSSTSSRARRGSPRCSSGQYEAEGAGGGWAFVLSDLKSLLETGEAIGGW